MNEYPIIEVPDDAVHEDEQMGTKPKFWYRDQEDQYWLFKQPRPETGEDWAEKVVCELAKCMGLPSATVELATSGDQKGTVTKNFLEPSEILIHGNELLFMADPHYPRDERYRVSLHTWESVDRIVSRPGFRPPLRWSPPRHVNASMDTFVGYLVLDAWVGNTDRHHENWGLVVHVISPVDCAVHLAPTFDHASSLGRELRDDRRDTLMREIRVPTYAAKSRSAMYESDNDRRPLPTIDLVRRAALSYPRATDGWLDSIAGIQKDRVREAIAAVPDDRMTHSAKRFAAELLLCNAEALQRLREENLR